MREQSEDQVLGENSSSNQDAAKVSENQDSLPVNVVDKQNVEEQSEAVRNKLSTRLMEGFNVSVMATFLLVGVAAFSPNADRAFIKDIIPPIISTQGTLLGASFCLKRKGN